MENKEGGKYVYMRYITINTETIVNGETVWYANKWKNFFLKIKRFFFRSKHYKDSKIASRYIKNNVDKKL